MTNYDVIEYKGKIVPISAPNHIAIAAKAYNFSPPDTGLFRLAEIGCGTGTNLLPLAFYNSESRFYGLDQSKAAVKSASDSARKIGLKNIEFINLDINTSAPAIFFPLDYVISHGVYSWVSQQTRDAILKFCSDYLSENGLAYISYNAQPGWATRKLVRETLLNSRAVNEATIGSKAKKAKDLASELLTDLPSRGYALGELLATELEQLVQGDESYVFHEYLTEHNDGFWLSEFTAQASKFGLKYIADAQFCRREGQIPVELLQSLSKQGLTQIEQEERADLLCGRFFHASILCRKDSAPLGGGNTLIHDTYIATIMRPCSGDLVNLAHGIEENFLGKQNEEVTLDAAITKSAALVLSAQWPFGMQANQLFEDACKLLHAHGCKVRSNARSQLFDELTILFESGVVDLRLIEPTKQTHVPKMPKLHALARYELDCGRALTTPYHLPLQLDADSCDVAKALDGSVSPERLYNNFKNTLVDQTITTLSRWGLLEPIENELDR